MKKSVLFLIPSLKSGGAEHQTAQQVNAFYEKGLKVSLCLLHPGLTIIDKIQIPKEDILILNLNSSVLNIKTSIVKLSAIYKLYKFCKSQAVTHIIANLPLGHWYGRILKVFIPSVKLLNYHRSLQYDANPLNTGSKKLFNAIQSKLARFTDDVSICISSAVKENVENNFFLKNPVVIHNSVLDYYETISTIPRADNQGKINIIVPGRLHPSKGHMFFLQAISNLTIDYKAKIDVTIMGGGQLEEELHLYIKKSNLDGIVSVAGLQPNEKMLAGMYHADFVIIPSIHEGFGNIAVEALMLGKTILSSNAGGLKEIIIHGKNGYIFKAGDEEDFLNLLRKLIEQYPFSLLEPAKVRRDYLDRFSFESHITKLSRLLD